MRVRKHYVDFSSGQLHVRTAGLDGAKKPLICLHMSPYSGAFYTPFMEAMAQYRPIICPDTPGYGGSDAIDNPTIETYAAAMIEMMDALDISTADIMGFHTGVFTAIEIAHTVPDRIGKLVLSGIPYVQPEDRDSRVAMFSKDRPYFTEPNYIQTRWNMGLDSRGGKSDDRCLELFAESLRPGVSGTNRGFVAVFKYNPDPVIASIKQPVYIPVPDEMLAQSSREIASAFQNATLEEWRELQGDLFDVAADEVAGRINAWLEG